MLLIGAGLLLNSFYKLQQIDLGLYLERVLTAEVFPNWSKYTTQDSRRQLFSGVLDRLRARPGIESVAVANAVPMASETAAQQRFAIEGRTYDEPDLRPQLETRIVSAAYFATVVVPVLAGRAFTTAGDAASLPVAVISRMLAARHWQARENTIGQRVTFDAGEDWLTIVGIVGDTRDHGLETEPPDQLYRPFTQGGTPTRVLVRARTDAMALSAQVRDVVHDLDAEQPVYNFRTLEQTRSDTLATRRLSMVLLGLFAGLALVITVTGIAAVIATCVSQRTREFSLHRDTACSRRRTMRP